MAESPTVLFLRDTLHGGDPAQAAAVAQSLADFAAAATTSLDVAIYDFRLTDPTLTATVVDAFTGAEACGVAVRIGYDAGKPAAATADTFAAPQADPAPPGTAEWVTDHFQNTGVAVEAIKAGGHLMHSEDVIRDAPTSSTVTAGAAAVRPRCGRGRRTSPMTPGPARETTSSSPSVTPCRRGRLGPTHGLDRASAPRAVIRPSPSRCSARRS